MNPIALDEAGVDAATIAKEIEIAIESNFIPISLGNTRLRTETAAIVACHSIIYVNQN
jgi:16S rRNA (uracil1498-N3)-methyltransferase